MPLARTLSNTNLVCVRRLRVYYVYDCSLSPIILSQLALVIVIDVWKSLNHMHKWSTISNRWNRHGICSKNQYFDFAICVLCTKAGEIRLDIVRYDLSIDTFLCLMHEKCSNSMSDLSQSNRIPKKILPKKNQHSDFVFSQTTHCTRSMLSCRWNLHCSKYHRDKSDSIEAMKLGCDNMHR